MKKKPQRVAPPRRDSTASDDAKLVKTACNIALECLNIVWKYLLVAGAPAVERAEPEFARGVRSDVQGFGWQQALRQPLESFVKQSSQRSIVSLRPLSPFADQEFVHKWDAWSDSVNELAIVIAQDLWKEVQRCEREYGAEAAWGHYALRDGLLFDCLRDEWRFRDIPIDWLGRCQFEERFAWEKSHQPPAAPKGQETLVSENAGQQPAIRQKKAKGPKLKFVDPDEAAIRQGYAECGTIKATVSKLKLESLGRVTACKRVARIVNRDRQAKSRAKKRS